METSVVKVNKPLSTKPRNSIDGKTAKRMNVNEESINVQPKKKVKARSLTPENNDLNLEGNSNQNQSRSRSASITFDEGGRTMHMSVNNPGEDSDQEYSTDQEVSFRQSQSTVNPGSSDEEYDEGQNDLLSDSPGQEDYDSEQEWDGGKDDDKNPTTVEEIDQQLQAKLLELQTLMNQKGLMGSAQMVNRSLGENDPPSKDMTSKPNKNSAVKHVNSTSKHNSLASKSEETIYENALKTKRTSSSSDDVDPDTSDEILELQFDKMQMIQGFPAFSDANSQCTTQQRAKDVRSNSPVPSTSQKNKERSVEKEKQPTPEE